MISIDRQACNGCGLCVEVCPSGALQLMDSLLQVDNNLCQECELCVDICPQNALVSYTLVEETLASHQPALEEALDTAMKNPTSKLQISEPSTIQMDTHKRSLGDWLGAAFNFLVFDLGPVIEGMIDSNQTPKEITTRSIRRDERTLEGRHGRGRNGRKMRRRRRGRW